jgi:alkaline phosphatase
MQKLISTWLFSLCCFGAAAQPAAYSVDNAHAHNDYENRTPFFMAYKAGFGSIEADIFLVGDELIVAHDSAELSRHRTLQSLYLIPLLTATQNHYGFVYGDSSKVLQMLIDIKSDSIRTLGKLVNVLAAVPELSNNPSIRWVITGNRPDPSLFGNYPSFIQFDGELSKDYPTGSLTRIAMLSNDLEQYSRWHNGQAIPEKDLPAVRAAVQKAHALHKPVRFWDAPDNPVTWAQLKQLQVDFINTDKVDELAVYLGKSK